MRKGAVGVPGRESGDDQVHSFIGDDRIQPGREDESGTSV